MKNKFNTYIIIYLLLILINVFNKIHLIIYKKTYMKFMNLQS